MFFLITFIGFVGLKNKIDDNFTFFQLKFYFFLDSNDLTLVIETHFFM